MSGKSFRYTCMPWPSPTPLPMVALSNCQAVQPQALLCSTCVFPTGIPRAGRHPLKHLSKLTPPQSLSLSSFLFCTRVPLNDSQGTLFSPLTPHRFADKCSTPCMLRPLYSVSSLLTGSTFLYHQTLAWWLPSGHHSTAADRVGYFIHCIGQQNNSQFGSSKSQLGSPVSLGSRLWQECVSEAAVTPAARGRASWVTGAKRGLS